MTRVETTTDIDAPPETVWSVLTAPDRGWDPFFVRLDGRFAVGDRLRVRLSDLGGGLRFRPVVVVADPPHELVWLGRLLLPRLFDGRHGFRLDPLPGGGTRLHHGEDFRGLLVPLAAASLRRTADGFRAFDAALRERAEATAHV
ncbi:SRPBCC domain-containing protein [Pseudonocardia tropica]|uniref:SRPBCC domain-containing protein n=1 Tax=Pseudonocardia tropica TaxID=681289 RepID=A0ABV1JXQ1_9PSEU